MTDGSGQEGDSLDNQVIEDLESYFDEKIRRLLHTSQTKDTTNRMRRSERRKKKPSYKWNGEAGSYLSHPYQ